MSIEAVLKQIKDEDVAYVDIRFTDTRGKVQHVTVDCIPRPILCRENFVHPLLHR